MAGTRPSLEGTKPKELEVVEKDYIVLSGRWIGAGDAFRVRYVEGGRVRVANAAGATSWDIHKAILLNRSSNTERLSV